MISAPPKPLVIIHGWSDDARSFRKLAHALEKELNRTAQQINLADYVSMDDEVTYDDLVAAMMKAWQDRSLPQTLKSVDVVVHSTGGLIIRHWLIKYFKPDQAPIDHLVMLAPANFGSPLAHKGQSFYGRIIKGFNSKKIFQVGKKLLEGLEVGSEYTWNLAMQDRFGDAIFYDTDKILCTVLIGNTGYSGIAAAANENGSDGTVRISSANLNGDFFDIDFGSTPLKPDFKRYPSKGKTAFGVMEGENHSTIVFKDGGPKNPTTLEHIVKGLTLAPSDFAAWCDQLEIKNQSITDNLGANAGAHGFQNTVFFVHDQFDLHVQDYFLEFYTDHNKHWLTGLFYENVIANVHSYTQDQSYRSVYIDCSVLYQQLEKKWGHLHLSLSALPEFKQNKNVGYRTFTDEDIGSIIIPKEHIHDMFMSNRTLLVRMTLRREQADHVFRIKKLADVT